MHTNLMKGIIFSDKTKEGTVVNIRVLTGPLSGDEFQAKKVQEELDGKAVYCYHVIGSGTPTYFLEKDVVVI